MSDTADPKHPADDWVEIIGPDDDVEILEGPDA